MKPQQKQYNQRLTSQKPLGNVNKEAFFQCVIIGSGFGGSVMAARLSPHFQPGELAVLERGKELQPGEFPKSMNQGGKELRSPINPLGLFDFMMTPDMDSLVGNALGGTSNIYASVLLEPFPETFDTCKDYGNPHEMRCWPSEVTYNGLKPYFNRVRQMLAIEKYIDRKDIAQGVTQHDRTLAGSFLYGAETGTDPVTGVHLTDYQGRTFDQRPSLAKADWLQRTMPHIQDVGNEGLDGSNTSAAAHMVPAVPPPNTTGNLSGTNPLRPTEQQGVGPFSFVLPEDSVQTQATHFADAQPSIDPAPEQLVAGGWGDYSKAPIAVNLTQHGDGEKNQFGVPQWKCTLCGDCVTGCNVGAKNTLTMNYLPLARSQGASIYTQVEVKRIRPSDRPDYRYRLTIVERVEEDGEIWDEKVIVYTNMVILSAGVFGTVKLMLKAQDEGDMDFSEQLGKRFSGNGDAIGISYNGVHRTNTVGFGKQKNQQVDWEVGPTITAIADFRRMSNRHHLIEDAAFPSLVVKPLSLLLGAKHLLKFNKRIWQNLGNRKIEAQADGALNHSQVWLSIGHDGGTGALSLDKFGGITIKWIRSGVHPVLNAARNTFKRLAELAGGSYVANPRDGFGLIGQRSPTPITVHPLGGCCMADDEHCGVVDYVGRVFRPGGGTYPGLYISDGSTCDGSLGANPSLTIAALAEQAAEQIIQHDLHQFVTTRRDGDGNKAAYQLGQTREGDPIADHANVQSAIDVQENASV